MDATKKEDTSTPANEAVSLADQLKAKYGKIYRVSFSIPLDDDHEKNVEYFFKRPSTPSYDRFVKTMSQTGATKAGTAFSLDCVADESREALERDITEYPGIALTVSTKLTELLGIVNTTNLKLL